MNEKKSKMYNNKSNIYSYCLACDNAECLYTGSQFLCCISSLAKFLFFFFLKKRILKVCYGLALEQIIFFLKYKIMKEGNDDNTLHSCYFNIFKKIQ